MFVMPLHKVFESTYGWASQLSNALMEFAYLLFLVPGLFGFMFSVKKLVVFCSILSGVVGKLKILTKSKGYVSLIL